MLILKIQADILNANPTEAELGETASFYEPDMAAIQAQTNAGTLREIIIEIDDDGPVHAVAAVTDAGEILSFLGLPCPRYCAPGKPPSTPKKLADYLGQ